jgi:hypothetical protein
MRKHLLSVVSVFAFAMLAMGSSESNEDRAARENRLRDQFSLSDREFDRGVEAFGSSRALQTALEFGAENGFDLDGVIQIKQDYGSLSDYEDAQERGMSLNEYRAYTAQINACGDDWRQCVDNTQLVDHYDGYSRVQSACQRRATEMARYGDPDFPWLSFGTYFTGTDYVETGIAVSIEPRAQFQNGFGAMVNTRVVCRYDLRAGEVLSVELN